MTIGNDSTTVNDCGNKSDWTGSTHSAPDDNTTGSAVPIFREGSQCMQAVAASSSDGFWHEDTAFDLTGEILVFWVWFSGPVDFALIGDSSIIIADGAGITGTVGRWAILQDMVDLSVGGWFPVVINPTQPDEGSAPTRNSIDSVGFEVNNTGGNDVKLIGFDFIHRMSQIEVSAQSVTMEQIATQDVSDDLGVFTGATPNFRCRVNLEIGAAASTTTWDEQGKALNFAAANSDHDIGFIFIDGTSGGTNYTNGEFLSGAPLNGVTYVWTGGASSFEIFTNPGNCDIFRNFASVFADGGEVDLPDDTGTNEVGSVEIVAGGSGYVVGEDLTGVSGTGTKYTLNVDAVSSGAVTAVSILTVGSYTVDPTNPDTTTSSIAGTGCTINVTMIGEYDTRGCTFSNMGEVDIGTHQFTDNKVVGATSGVLYAGTGSRNASDNQYIGNVDAMRFDTAQTITLDGDTFTGNTTDIHFSGTGTLTIDLVNGANPVTSRVTGGGTVVINNPSVTLTINVDDETGANLQNARVLVEAANGAGDLPFDDTVTITRSGSVATVSHTAHNMVTGDLSVIRFADQPEYNSVHVITVTGANDYTYTVSGSPDSPATGTIKATGALIDALTDVNGQATKSRAFASDQDIKGFIRLSTTSPRYRSFNLAGNTVDNADGLIITVRMVRDE